MSTIDEIRKYYRDKFDAKNPKEEPLFINLINFGLLDIHMSDYKFEKKMEDINRIINEGKIQDTKLIEECSKQLRDMKVSIDDILKKRKEDEDLSELVLFHMQSKYKYYLKRPEALDTYQKVANSIIKENVEKLIKYEKIFLLYNEKLIDISKQLKINN